MSTREELQKKEFLIKILVKMKEKKERTICEKKSQKIFIYEIFSQK